VKLYDHLASQTGGPAIELNRAIAESRCRGPAAALARLQAIPAASLPANWPLWHAVLGQLHADAGQPAEAIRHLERALAQSDSPAERRVIAEKLARQRSTG
jgi:RNA polymerase sigma-70 factor (ECF subfamily)